MCVADKSEAKIYRNSRKLNQSINGGSQSLITNAAQTRLLLLPKYCCYYPSLVAKTIGHPSLVNFVIFCAALYKQKDFPVIHIKINKTQVGSPAVRLRLARCTAWVKRWSEAMDFLQTIFKTNNVPIVSVKREAKIYKNSRNIMSLQLASKVRQKSTETHAT